MTQKFANNYSTTVAATFGSGDTQLTLASVAGLPSLAGGHTFLLTVYRLTGVVESGHEVVRVTGIAGNIATVDRAVEGAAASQFNVGDRVELRVTAGSMQPLADHVANVANPHGTTKAHVGLGNVDNTSDVNKPVSSATQAALDLKFNKNGGAITGAFNQAKGADIASAATINLDTATGDYVVVTGGTTITGVTLSAGVERCVRFASALTLTNGANLVLPGNANIAVAAGDLFTFIGDTGGVVRVKAFQPIAGASSGAMVYLGGINVTTAAASIDVENVFDTTYDRYVVMFTNIFLTSGGTPLVRVKIAGSWRNSTNNYEFQVSARTTGNGEYSSLTPSDSTAFQVSNVVGNATTDSLDMDFYLNMPADTEVRKRFRWDGTSANYNLPRTNALDGIGQVMVTGALTGIRILATSGTIKGTVRVYGFKNN